MTARFTPLESDILDALAWDLRDVAPDLAGQFAESLPGSRRNTGTGLFTELIVDRYRPSPLTSPTGPPSPRPSRHKTRPPSPVPSSLTSIRAARATRNHRASYFPASCASHNRIGRNSISFLSGLMPAL